MSAATRIEWTRGDDGSAGATWNPVTGCTKVSAGCDHCYAATLAFGAPDLLKTGEHERLATRWVSVMGRPGRGG